MYQLYAVDLKDDSQRILVAENLTREEATQKVLTMGDYWEWPDNHGAILTDGFRQWRWADGWYLG